MIGRSVTGVLGLLLLFSLVSVSSLYAQRPEFQPPEVDPDLPNVLLIGDSISIGYMLATRKELSGEANVWRPITNCGPSTKGLESLDAWLGGAPNPTSCPDQR